MTVDEVLHPKAKIRRDAMRALGICINSSLPMFQRAKRAPRIEHGPVVRGGRCARCIEVHRRSR